MALFINWFPVTGLSESERIYVQEFSSFEDSDNLIRSLRESNRNFRRRRLEDDQVQLALMGERKLEPGWSLVTVSLREWPSLASALLEFAFTDWLKDKGLTVRFDKISGLHITKPDVADVSSLLSVAPSVVAKAFVNPGADKYGFTLNWQVEEKFGHSLLDARLQSVCINRPLVRFDSRSSQAEEGRNQRRYLGYGLRLSGDNIVIRSRENTELSYPLGEVTLESNSENKRAVRELLSKSEQYSSFRRAQQMSFTLTPGGQRNHEVFRQRIQAIRSFLTDQDITELAYSIPTPERRLVSMSLKPYRIGR